MIEVAREVLAASEEGLKFADLWERVQKELELTPEEAEARIGHFYSDLSLAGSTFVVLGDNVWDLRSRHPYSKVHIEMKDVYESIETTDDDAAELLDEAEYNESVRGGLSDGGISDTGVTDGEGLEDAGGAGINDYIGGRNDRLGDDF